MDAQGKTADTGVKASDENLLVRLQPITPEKKVLDKKHKVCYNECVKRGTSTAKSTMNRGNGNSDELKSNHSFTRVPPTGVSDEYKVRIDSGSWHRNKSCEVAK